MSIRLGNTLIASNATSGFEIGDIGIAPLGIDETKGKRRYLNGQILIQERYKAFTNKLKNSVALYPSLACTEEEWQTTATMSVGGQVGKFVIDDETGTIRLPKIIMPIQGLTDLSKLGEIVEAGLPNITGNFVIDKTSYYTSGSWGNGAFYTNSTAANGNNADLSGPAPVISFDASRSNPIYGNSNTVQQEQIQYPYFIQVATGAETEDNIINEIELNNPYSFGDSKYSPVALNNLSWLKSEGQYNPKAVYPSFYDWVLINTNNGVEGFKFTTDEYTDYDYVINTSDETFRLPLLDGSEDLPSGKRDDLTIGASGTPYTAPANGWFVINADGTSIRMNTKAPMDSTYGMVTGVSNRFQGTLVCKRGGTATLLYDAISSTASFYFFYAQGNGSLYFYVGETVQNANLINAGRIEEALANKADKTEVDGEWVYPESVPSLVAEMSLNSSTNLELDLTEILPKDNNIYECILSTGCLTGSTSGNYINIAVNASTMPSDRFINICGCQTRSSGAVATVGSTTIIIGMDRKLIVRRSTNFNGNLQYIYVIAYRKVR